MEVSLKEETLLNRRTISSRVKKDLLAYEELKLEHEKLMSASNYWSEEFAILKNAADEAKACADYMENHAKNTNERLSQIMDYISSTIGEFPKRIDEVWYHMTDKNTHEKVFQFVMFCTTMGKRIGLELEDLQRKKARR